MKPGVFLLSLVALLVAIAIAVSFGSEPVSLARAVLDSTSLDHAIVFEVRLPRVLLGAIAGAGLSVVGVALQSMLRNALAEPFVLGVSGGSAVGATIAIVVGVSSATFIPLFALAGGSARPRSSTSSRRRRRATEASARSSRGSS